MPSSSMNEKPPAPDETILLAQQYPSPSVDDRDTPFYDINNGENQADHIMEDRDHPIEHDPNQRAPQIAPSMETHGQQGHQQQEHLQPQHAEHKPEDHNTDVAEELRLAAQLSQGLAPMMAEAGTLPDGLPQDPNVHAQSEDTNPPNQDHLQTQDPMHQVHEPEAHGQDQHLHGILPLPHHDPQHPQLAQQYGDHAAQQHQHLTHVSMGLLGPADSTPPRKRSKASRACDECRRKKVKCDAMGETGEEACSNCRRAQLTCLFSRIPQKRGPSKGYIKELADRIHSIEGKLVGQANAADVLDIMSRRESSDTFSPLNENAKRPFSSISRDVLATPESNRHAGWATRPSTSNAGLAPQPIIPKNEGPAQRAPEAQPDELPVGLPDGQPKLDETLFNGYLEFIHGVLPFLPGSRIRQADFLSQCHHSLAEAFTTALIGTIESFLPGSRKGGEAQAATRMLAVWESDGLEHYSVAKLVYLQTLLLLAIVADNNGPLSVKGQLGGPSKTSFLARAVAVAYSMDLRNRQVDSVVESDPDSDSSGRTALRAWWSLVALDRWNSTGTGEPLLIHQDSVVLSPGLRRLMGEGAFQFMKLSYLLGPSVSLFHTPARTLTLTSGTCAAFSRRNNAALEMWRLDLPDIITSTTHPIIHLAYWHCRLLDYLLMPSALGSDVAWAAKETISMLSANEHLRSPFNHYFTCLAGLSLGELAKIDKTRDEATQFLSAEFLEADIAPSAWDPYVREKVAESLRPSTAQNLQQLADLATATGLSAASAATTTAAAVVDRAEEPAFRAAENYEDMGYDPRPMLRAGYLNAVLTA